MLKIHICVQIRRETVQWGVMVFFVFFFHKNRNLSLSQPSTIQNCVTYLPLQPEEIKGRTHFYSYLWCVLKKHCQLTSGSKDIYFFVFLVCVFHIHGL